MLDDIRPEPGGMVDQVIIFPHPHNCPELGHRDIFPELGRVRPL